MFLEVLLAYLQNSLDLGPLKEDMGELQFIGLFIFSLMLVLLTIKNSISSKLSDIL